MTRAQVPPQSLGALHPDAFTEPFWRAAAEHRLTCAQCASCGAFRMPPTAFCPRCRSQEVTWAELSGRGTVFSFTVARHALTPDLAGSLPYVVAVVDLEGAPGARLVANVVGTEVEDVRIGMPVEVVWEDVEGSPVSLYRFRPAG
ncbi:MAG TPA: Zn-ribbon domain-containing OB-fold protein [Acidimicrobiales bacterium]|nr:Zn-ribbon domain-containing OB-fold protein [Acidimicrobiales bacterium]